MDDQKTELAHPKIRTAWRDRLMLVLVALGLLLTLIWSCLIAYVLGWLAWYFLR